MNTPTVSPIKTPQSTPMNKGKRSLTTPTESPVKTPQSTPMNKKKNLKFTPPKAPVVVRTPLEPRTMTFQQAAGSVSMVMGAHIANASRNYPLHLAVQGVLNVPQQQPQDLDLTAESDEEDVDQE